MCVFRTVKGEPQKGMFWVAANADWARARCYSTSQDSIKELMNCVSVPAWPAGGRFLAPVRVSLWLIKARAMVIIRVQNPVQGGNESITI